MKTLITRTEQSAFGTMFLTLAIVILYLLWASDPIARAQSEASHEIIAAMISAHGGMEKWRSTPTVSFENRSLPAGAQKPSVSQVTVEQGRRRAYLDFPESNARIAWDGKQAWSENWQAPIPPRSPWASSVVS